MDLTPHKRNRGGRPGAKDVIPKSKKSFRWNAELQFKMAQYLNDNYIRYKNALENGQKISFLRAMRTTLKVECDDIQLKNGFASFLKKYDDVKCSLNSSGFGVNPEENGLDLNAGWIKKQCPYYEILDQVLGTRSNITPPFVTFSSSVGSIGDSELLDIESQDNSIRFAQKENIESSELDKLEITTAEEEEEMLQVSTKTKPSSSFESFIKKTFQGLGVKKSTTEKSRSALGVFAEIMSEKMIKQNDVENAKLEFEKEKHSTEENGATKLLEIELLKIKANKEAQDRKLEHEQQLSLQELQDRKEARAYELKKSDQQQNFELEKLKLQIN